MATLFFDTETSDMIVRGLGPSSRQPHIVQLAALLVDGGTETSMATLIRPDAWTVSLAAERVHGISTARARRDGVPIREAIRRFHDVAMRADVLVAHNIEFDRVMVLSEYQRLAMEHPFGGKREFCTMKAATNIIKLPGYYGYKWPTLEEAYEYFTDRPLDRAHDALADVKACRAVYEALTTGKKRRTCSRR